MKNLKFTYLSAKNFLCFGEEGIEIYFDRLPNIVLIEGRNFHDENRQTGKPGSNGSGKSSTIAILSYTLFGKTGKSDMHLGDFVHKNAQGKCRCEVQWDQYRVVREQSGKSHKVALYEKDGDDWKDISKGAGTIEINKDIVTKLGLDFQTFMKIVVFDDDNRKCFLECDTPTKRSIIENLLSLDKYHQYSKSAKTFLLDSVKDLKTKCAEYDRLREDFEMAKTRLSQAKIQEQLWREGKEKEITILKNGIASLQIRIDQSDFGKAMMEYESAKQKIVELVAGITKFNELQETMKNLQSDLRSGITEQDSQIFQESEKELALRNQLSSEETRVIHLTNQIGRLLAVEDGVRCERCLMIVDAEHAKHEIVQCEKEIIDIRRRIIDIRSKHEEISTGIQNLKRKRESAVSKIKAIDDKIREFSSKISTLQSEVQQLSQISRPDADRTIAVFQQQIQDATHQIAQKEKEICGPSPFTEILKMVSEDMERKADVREKKKIETDELEAMVPYYRFWVQAFGDEGIRKYVVERIIPSLNNQIAYWLNVLIDGHIKIEFDSSLDVHIERVPHEDPFLYSAMSGGERRRMNLAVMQAFAHIMMINSGCSPSLVFLDEVAINIDANGIESVYNMIREISAQKQVFVTTHDVGLLELLKDTPRLVLERREGATKLVS